MAYLRVRTCLDCGQADEIRKDNKALRCRPCARDAAPKPRRKGPRTATTLVCGQCGEPTLSRPSDNRGGGRRYCSVSCRRAAQRSARVERECVACGMLFSVARSVLSGKTNASARFCSRPCYETHLCRTDRTSGRGCRWDEHRAEALRRAPFCALCGTMKRLQVHHIIPWRISHDNRQANLIPLCPKHHKKVEMLLIETERCGFDDMAFAAWNILLRSRQDDTRSVLMRLAGELRYGIVGRGRPAVLR
jgi:hypothetical protein